jgi:uncharacterized protein (TIGR02266 family)
MKVQKRQHPRIDVWLNAEFQSSKELVSCYMTNISKGGMFLQTDDPLELEAVMALTFQLPGQEHTIRVKGKVVWSNPSSGTGKPGMGVQFTEMPIEDRHILDGFIQAELARGAA